MSNKYQYAKAASGGVLLIVMVLVGTLYASDYKQILSDNPDVDLFLLKGFDGADRIELLARSDYEGIDYLRWRFEGSHTVLYFGNSKVTDSYWKLKAYYDLNGKVGYRDIVQKVEHPLEFVQDTVCTDAVVVKDNGAFVPEQYCELTDSARIVSKIDYYRDSAHKTLIGTFIKETQLSPDLGKETITFIPADKSMPCQLIWVNSDLKGAKSQVFKLSGQSIDTATFHRKFDNGLVINWNDAKELVSHAKEYASLTSADRLEVAYLSTKGDQLIDPEIGLGGEIIYCDGSVEYNYTYLNKTIYITKWHVVNESYQVPVYVNVTDEVCCEPLNETCYECLTNVTCEYCKNWTHEVVDHYDTEWHMVNESYQEAEIVPDEQTNKIIGVTVCDNYYPAKFIGGNFFYNNTLSEMLVPPGDRNWLEFSVCRDFELEKGTCYFREILVGDESE